MALGNGERYYSPTYARFIQQDSFAGNSMNPQSMNRFSYGHNNPNKYTDPSGHAPQDLGKSDSWNFWNDASNSNSYLGKAAGFTGLFFYEVGDMLTFGGVSRQDRTMTQYQRGEISGSEALWRTTANIAVSAPLLVAGLMTGGASVYVQIGVGALAAGVQRFGTDNYEMSFEGRTAFSSLKTYAMDIAMGAVGGAIGGLANKFGGKIASYVGGKLSSAKESVLEATERGLQSLANKAGKASESVKEMLGKIGGMLDDSSFAMAGGIDIPVSQIDDLASRTTMLSESLDNAPMGGGKGGLDIKASGGYQIAFDNQIGKEVGLGLVEDGYLSLAIYSKETGTQLRGSEIFKSIYKKFIDSGKEIQGIFGLWNKTSDNTAMFNKLISSGYSPEEAALETFTGKMASRHGYTNARIDYGKSVRTDDGLFESVTAIFEKP